MQCLSRIILSALLASSWSALAWAETADRPEPPPTIDFASVTAAPELDRALEQLIARETSQTWQEPSGPTRMACRESRSAGAPETCTVTATRISPPPVPASLAAH